MQRTPDALTRSRIDVGIQIRRTSVGMHRHVPTADHHVTVHSGPPVRVSMPDGAHCVRTHGEINVFPAGLAEDWFEDDASDMLDVRLSAPLVHRAAEEMGLDPARVGLEPRCHLRDVQIEHIAWALAAEHRESSPNGLLYRESLGMALAVHLLGRYRRAAKPRRGLTPEQLARIHRVRRGASRRRRIAPHPGSRVRG